MKAYKDELKLGNDNTHEIHLENSKGVRVSFLTLGGIITEILVPDKEGRFDNIVLSYEDYEDYLANPTYFGAIIGRTAGRIKDAYFTLNDQEYILAKNYGPNSGQGGKVGFDKRVFDHSLIVEDNEASAVLTLISPDLEEGYPGELKVTVTYTLGEDDTFTISYGAEASDDTLVNLTNHSYFNLSGSFEESIKYHELYVDSEHFTEIDDTSAPTGNLLEVENSPFDFRYMKEIGEDMQMEHEQLRKGNGYDHTWLFRKKDGTKVRLAHRFTGRVMEIETDNQAVVIYTQNYTQGQKIANGTELKERRSVAIEVQKLPIGRNEAFKEFSIIRAGSHYETYTRYKFFVETSDFL